MSKPIEEMSADELRLAIAEAKGIEYRVSDGGMDWIVGERMHREFAEKGEPIGKFTGQYDNGQQYVCEDSLPDWPGDIGAAWELVEDAKKSGVGYGASDFIQNGKIDGHEFILFDPIEGPMSKDYEAVGETLPIAICRAWLAWKAAE